MDIYNIEVSPFKVHVSSLWSVLNVKLVKLSHFLKDNVVAAYENNKKEENLKIFVQLRRQTAGYLWDVWISEDLEQRNSRCEGKTLKASQHKH